MGYVFESQVFFYLNHFILRLRYFFFFFRFMFISLEHSTVLRIDL